MPYMTKISKQTMRFLLILASVCVALCFAETCPNGQGCESKNGDVGCCPYKDAVCCSDKKSCCPKGVLEHQHAGDEKIEKDVSEVSEDEKNENDVSEVSEDENIEKYVSQVLNVYLSDLLYRSHLIT
ncbi:hypothetical protein Anas_05055 [Armadillidium nasatum]|uniref:Granulins domain-containing protein n=1 Tax=Armadillidium nasatum TaxID=96803 RepID=A0A5N5TMK3_9CRUS|nr:hypothetical protein Anas_05055 [Armadillidium nasatum]